jgi:hypothetical protein
MFFAQTGHRFSQRYQNKETAIMDMIGAMGLLIALAALARLFLVQL